MRWIKLFEDFKNNNIEGDLLTIDDMIRCIKSNGVIYAEIVKNYPNNDENVPIRPISVDEDGLITVDIDGNEYSVDIDRVKRIEF